MKDEIAYALMNLYFLLTCFDKMLVGEISEKIILKKIAIKVKKKTKQPKTWQITQKKSKLNIDWLNIFVMP